MELAERSDGKLVKMMLSRLTEVLEKLASTSSVKKASESFEKSNEMWLAKLAAMKSDGLCGPL